MINKVTLIGNLGADPEVRALESGVSVARISVATNESYKDQTSGQWIDKTEWHNVVAWRGLADRAQNSLKKGMTVYVEGKLQTRKWQDKDGNDRYSTDVVANYFRIVSKGNSQGSGNSNFPTSQDIPAAVNNTPASNPTPAAPSAPAVDDDLPF